MSTLTQQLAGFKRRALKAGSLSLFLGLLVLLGIGGADVTIWLPEVYPIHARGVGG